MASDVLELSGAVLTCGPVRTEFIPACPSLAKLVSMKHAPRSTSSGQAPLFPEAVRAARFLYGSGRQVGCAFKSDPVPIWISITTGSLFGHRLCAALGRTVGRRRAFTIPPVAQGRGFRATERPCAPLLGAGTASSAATNETSRSERRERRGGRPCGLPPWKVGSDEERV